MQIIRLDVRNLRCLGQVTMELRTPDDPESRGLAFPNVNLLVGTNGGGKSTILKAIALGILSPHLAGKKGSQARDRLPADLIRRGQRWCDIEVMLRLSASARPEGFGARISAASGRVGVALQRDASRYVEQLDAPGQLLAGYGATRVAGAPSSPGARRGESPRSEPLSAVGSLLFGDPALVPLERWLPRQRGRRDEVIALVDKLLPPDTDFAGRTRAGEFVFEHRGVAVPARALSDGYQAYLCWVCDLLFRLTQSARRSQELTDIPGIVLVDEIDQRLHPRWQQWLVPALAGAFPRLQFVLSSHSPLVASNLSRRNLFVMESDDDAGAGAQRVCQLEEEVYGKTVDRILQGAFFGLDSTRGVGFQRELRDLSRRARRGDAGAAVAFLRTLAATDEGDRER